MDRIRLKFSQKNDDLFDEIWREYYPKLTVFVNCTCHTSNTEDLVQEIMFKVFKNLKKYNPAYSFNTWIYSIARNHALDSLKKEMTIRKINSTAKIEEELSSHNYRHNPETILLEKELQTDISVYIDSLPEVEREISFLKFHEDLKYKDISRITGIPVGTIKYHVHNIKKKFTQYYGEHHEN
jgi:RNA polymerase sigma-70 factor (ECF subfamily)